MTEEEKRVKKKEWGLYVPPSNNSSFPIPSRSEFNQLQSKNENHFCRYCGAHLPEDSHFCQYCGKKL